MGDWIAYLILGVFTVVFTVMGIKVFTEMGKPFETK